MRSTRDWLAVALLAVFFLALQPARHAAEAQVPAAKFAAPKYQAPDVKPAPPAVALTLEAPEELVIKTGRTKALEVRTNGLLTMIPPEGDVLDVLPVKLGTWYVSGDEGTHTLIVVAALEGKVLYARVKVVIGKPVPPAPPMPPVPPAPPVPVDPIARDLQSLFNAEASPDKVRHASLLASVYGDAVSLKVADNAAQVLADLRVLAKKVGLGETDLALLRSRIAVELKARLPATSTAAISDDQKKALVELYGRLNRALVGLK